MAQAAREAETRLITLFLSGYGKKIGVVFVHFERPDDYFRNRESADLLATDTQGRTYGLEHTLLQPFPRQKERLEGSLSKVFEPLKLRKTSGYNIDVVVSNDAIKPGPNWEYKRDAIHSWFDEHILRGLREGWSYHVVPVRGGSVGLAIDCTATFKDDDGRVSVMYANPHMKEQFVDSVLLSCRSKLPKLGDTRADRKILLFEKEWGAYSSETARKIIYSLALQLPELACADEIWIADTYWWTRSRADFVRFTQVWPFESRETLFAHERPAGGAHMAVVSHVCDAESELI